MDKVIGTYEDLQHDEVIYFVYSDSAIHRIMRYKVGDARTTLVLEWEGLDFQEEEKITGIGVVDDLLFWTDGRNELRQINMTRRALYDTLKDTDPHFANLIKRPPLIAPVADKVTTASTTSPNHIHDDTYQFTYRYVYPDEEKSVFAPFSTVVPFEYQGANADTRQKISVGLPVGTPPVNGLVKQIEFAVKRGSLNGLYIIKRFPISENPNALYLFDFDNSYVGEIVADDEASRLFDNIPVTSKALTVARNRVFVGNYAEGYDNMGTADISLALVMNSREYGRRLWKSNSNVRFGVAYYDYAGRTMGVISKPEWGITFPDFNPHDTTNVPTAVTVTLEMEKPAWATSWQLVRSENLKYSFYLQGYGIPIYRQDIHNTTLDLQFISNIGGGLGPTPDYATVKELFIDIYSLADRSVGYTFEQGDMVNITFGQTDNQGNISPKKLFNIPILGQEGSLLKIPVTTNILTFYHHYHGLVYEIFRTHKQENADKFYETGQGGIFSSNTQTEVITITGDSWLTENTLKNPMTRSSFELPEQSGRIDYEDEDIIVYFPFLEAMSPWDRYYAKWAVSLGRPNAILPPNLAKRVYKPNFERFSNKYLSGTQVNGLNSFEAFNEKELPRENGPIQFLQLASNTQSEGSVLVAGMQNEAESQYLGEVQFRDTQGQTTVAISDQVIGSTNTLRGGFGTINPESRAYHNGRIYWWDATKAEVVRYSVDGLTPLATQHNMREFFREVSRRQLALGNRVKVYGGYYPEREEYVLTFGEVRDFISPHLPGGVSILTVPIEEQVVFESFTIAFSERIQGFSTFYSFKPEYYAKSNTRFISFLEGKLYVHGGANAIPNNFYGVQYTSQVRAVYNQNPDLVKVWQGTMVEAQQQWVAKEITNEKEQESRISPLWYENREGVHYAPIKRNVNSKGFTDEVRALHNGDVMRSQWLEVLFENNSLQRTRLDAIALSYIESLGHTELR